MDSADKVIYHLGPFTIAAESPSLNELQVFGYSICYHFYGKGDLLKMGLVSSQLIFSVE